MLYTLTSKSNEHSEMDPSIRYNKLRKKSILPRRTGVHVLVIYIGNSTKKLIAAIKFFEVARKEKLDIISVIFFISTSDGYWDFAMKQTKQDAYKS